MNIILKTYIGILILSILEGPITSFVTAGLSASGVVYLPYIIIVVLLGDIIGDCGLYLAGRFFGKKIDVLKRFKIFSEEKHFLSIRLKKRTFLYFLIVKSVPYLSTPSLIYAGIQKIKFTHFFAYSFLISIFVKIMYLALGYFSVISINKLNIIMNGGKKMVLYIIFGGLLFLASKKFYKFLGKRLEKKLEREQV